MLRLIGAQRDGYLGGQLGFTLPECVAKRQYLFDKLRYCSRKLLGTLQRNSRGDFRHALYSAKLDPEMSGRCSYARIDRCGPQEFGFVGGAAIGVL